jgi:hypothetical protein
MKKAIITIQFEIEDNFYVGERKTKKERIRQYEEDFSDIEVLENHIPKYGYDVKVRLKEE